MKLKNALCGLFATILAVFAAGTQAEAKFMTVSGRTALGYFQTDKGGSLDTSTFQVPDARLYFKFEMPADIRATFRMNLNNNAFNRVDYLYFDVPLAFMNAPSVTARIGQFQHPVSMEMEFDDLVNQDGTNNSVGVFSGFDRGLWFMGKSSVSNYGLTYDVAITDGSRTANTANPDLDGDKALTVRLGTKLTDALTVTGTWHQSGDLGTGQSASSVADVVDAPGGTTKNWDRQMWQIHLDYAFSNGILMGYFGQFDDDSEAIGGTKGDRDGKMWMVGGRYDLTSKFYLAGMYSALDMKGGQLIAASGGVGSIGGATGGFLANEMTRLEMTLGYRLAENIRFKFSWAKNDRKYTAAQTAAGVTEPDDDLRAAYMTLKF